MSRFKIISSKTLTTILLIFFILVYVYLLFWWDKINRYRLSLTNSVRIKLIHYVLLGLCIVLGIFHWGFALDIRGAWTSRVIIIAMLITGILISFTANKTTFNKFSNLYFKLFSWSPIPISLTLILFPFLAMVVIISLEGKLFNPYSRIYYEDDKLRIQSSATGALGYSRINIYRKYFLFEKCLYPQGMRADEINSAKVHYDNDSTRVIFSGIEHTSDSVKIIALKKVE